MMIAFSDTAFRSPYIETAGLLEAAVLSGLDYSAILPLFPLWAPRSLGASSTSAIIIAEHCSSFMPASFSGNVETALLLSETMPWGPAEAARRRAGRGFVEPSRYSYQTPSCRRCGLRKTAGATLNTASIWRAISFRISSSTCKYVFIVRLIEECPNSSLVYSGYPQSDRLIHRIVGLRSVD